MNLDDIRAFIRENREIAQVQARRWEGVDPSRLLQALDYLEEALDEEDDCGELSEVHVDDELTELSTAYLKDGLSRYAEQCHAALQTLQDVSDLRGQLAPPIEMLVNQMNIETDVFGYPMDGGDRYVRGKPVQLITIELSARLDMEQIEHLWLGMRKLGTVKVSF